MVLHSLVSVLEGGGRQRRRPRERDTEDEPALFTVGVLKVPDELHDLLNDDFIRVVVSHSPRPCAGFPVPEAG